MLTLPTRDFAAVVDPHYLEDSLLTYPYGALTFVTDLAGLNPPVNVHLIFPLYLATDACCSGIAARSPIGLARLVPPNARLGVSVESKTYAWRVDRLRAVDAAVRFVSAEPLLGPLADLDLSGIACVITAGQSRGAPARATSGGRLLDSCAWSAYPAYASPATSREPRYVREPTRR